MRATESAGKGRARAANADPTKELAGSKNAEAPSKSQFNGTATAYYDAPRKEFVIRLADDSYQSRTEKQFRRWLRQNGVIGPCAKDEKPSEKIEAFLEGIMEVHHVDYVGKLAGFRPGFYQLNGRRILVTEGFNIPEPDKGDPHLIVEIIEGVLGHEQAVILYAWLKLAIESLRAGKPRVGQVLVMAGPINCGKSFIQHQIITAVLGGRSEKAFLAMSRDHTSFNDSLFLAEHQIMEDDASSGDLRTRRALGVEWKKIAANDINECHAKGRSLLSLPAFRRLSVSINDETEHLLTIPPLDETIADKVILLQAKPYTMPMPTETDEQRNELTLLVAAQIPYLVSQLLDWKIPKELREPTRYGVITYQNPELLAKLGLLAPENQLLALIDEFAWKPTVNEHGEEIPRFTRKGKSNDLLKELRQSATTDQERRLDRILNFPNSFGTYLGRLCRRQPMRVTQHTAMGYVIFTVHAPPK